jgi:hypothetical protein
MAAPTVRRHHRTLVRADRDTRSERRFAAQAVVARDGVASLKAPGLF